MYEKVDSKEAGVTAANQVFNIFRNNGFDTTKLDDKKFKELHNFIAKTVEILVSDLQRNMMLMESFLRQEIKEKDMAYNDLIESANGQIEHKNNYKEKYHKVLEENYNLRLSIDNYKEIFDRKDRVHNNPNKDCLDLKKKYEKLTKNKSDLEFILRCLETSCEYDESCNVPGLLDGNPEKYRYNDLKICANKLRRILE